MDAKTTLNGTTISSTDRPDATQLRAHALAAQALRARGINPAPGCGWRRLTQALATSMGLPARTVREALLERARQEG